MTETILGAAALAVIAFAVWRSWRSAARSGWNTPGNHDDQENDQ